MSGKPPAEGSVPHCAEAERAVIGCVLLDPECAVQVAGFLRSGDFHVPEHRRVFAAIEALHEAGRAIDEGTVAIAVLDGDGDAARAAALRAFLAGAVEGVVCARNVMEYARFVRDKAALRETMAAGQRIASMAAGHKGEVASLLSEVESVVFSLSGGGDGRTYRSMWEVSSETAEEVQRVVAEGRSVIGVPTGFRCLDRVTSGLHPGDLSVIAARPSMGKTTLALNVAVHAARNCGVPTAFFSMEMGRRQLMLRAGCAASDVDSHRIRTGMVSPEEASRLLQAIRDLAETPMYVDDTSVLTALELRSRVRRMQREHGVRLVVVDYLQLMSSGHASRRNDRVQEVSEISRALKGTAKDLGVAVVALSQLNRGLEGRIDKRPMLSDLRESGAIEQDSDLIMFIYREEVYSKEKTPRELRGVAEINVAKQRNGPVDTVRLRFLPGFTRFEEEAAVPRSGGWAASREAEASGED